MSIELETDRSEGGEREGRGGQAEPGKTEESRRAREA